ncbi:MAG: hypothetical protein L3K19_08670 [Thermoplasmata archaeon]|nr:hypothetical protein [Thermoplasmata archaeon]
MSLPMSGFRGSDETLEHEIVTLEEITRVRLRRYAREQRDLDKDLRELRAERARRKARAEVPGTAVEGVGSAASA